MKTYTYHIVSIKLLPGLVLMLGLQSLERNKNTGFQIKCPCTDYWSAEISVEHGVLSRYVEEKGFVRPTLQAKFAEKKQLA